MQLTMFGTTKLIAKGDQTLAVFPIAAALNDHLALGNQGARNRFASWGINESANTFNQGLAYYEVVELAEEPILPRMGHSRLGRETAFQCLLH